MRLPCDQPPLALIFPPAQDRLRGMKGLLTFLLLLACATRTIAGERVALYAKLTVPLVVELSDSAVWEMEKGDCFPVVAFKESHTKLILRLAGVSFVVPSKAAVIVSEKDTPSAIESYRVTVNNYINGFSARWRRNAEAGRPE